MSRLKRIASPHSKSTDSIGSESRQILSDIAAALLAYASGKPLETWLAAAYGAQLLRILDPPALARSGPAKELAIAISYLIRRDLHPREPFKSTRAKVARQYGVSDESVSTIATRNRSRAMAWIAQLDSSVERDGLTRRQVLQRELRESEPRRARVKQTRRKVV